jgi:hypothetical protein
MKEMPNTKHEIRISKQIPMTKIQNSKFCNEASLEDLIIWILNLPALLSRFRVTSGLMEHDPSGKSKVIDVWGNDLTG